MPLRGLGALSGGALAAWHAVTRLGPESQRSGSRGPVPATRSIHVDGSADRQTRPRDVGHDRFTRGGRVDAFHRADERHQRAHQVRWRADRHGARGVLCLPPMRRKPRHARQSHRRRVRCLLPRFDGAILLRDGTVATSDSVVIAAPRSRRPSLLHCRSPGCAHGTGLASGSTRSVARLPNRITVEGPTSGPKTPQIPPIVEWYVGGTGRNRK